MISLQRFDKENYSTLITWIDSPEVLMQFGGPAFIFPLTAEQIDKSLEDKNRLAFSIVDVETNKMIGYSEIYVREDAAQFARIIIGDKNSRGKGLCGPLMKLLLDYTFKELHRPKVYLNVFDWNLPAINCYKKAGFRINPGKELYREINGKKWTAVNMIAERD